MFSRSLSNYSQPCEFRSSTPRLKNPQLVYTWCIRYVVALFQRRMEGNGKTSRRAGRVRFAPEVNAETESNSQGTQYILQYLVPAGYCSLAISTSDINI